MRTALQAILNQQEPYPAVVMNRHWEIQATNGAATRFFGMLLDGRTPQGAGNILRLMFHPEGLRPVVENWEAVAWFAACIVKRLAARSMRQDARSWPKCSTTRACRPGGVCPILARRLGAGRRNHRSPGGGRSVGAPLR